MQDSMIFYKSFADAIDELPIDCQLDAYKAIVRYAFTEEEQDVAGAARVAYIMAKPQIDANIKRKNNGAKGGRPKKTYGFEKEKPMVLKSKTDGCKTQKPNDNVNVNVNVNVNEKTKRFVAPSVEDVAAYCKERGNGIDAQAFVDFYESKGWMIGKNKMKDWKAAVRTWEKKHQPEKKTKFDNFDGRKYDFDRLEKEVYGP